MPTYPDTLSTTHYHHTIFHEDIKKSKWNVEVVIYFSYSAEKKVPSLEIQN